MKSFFIFYLTLVIKCIILEVSNLTIIIRKKHTMKYITTSRDNTEFYIKETDICNSHVYEVYVKTPNKRKYCKITTAWSDEVARDYIESKVQMSKY